MNKLRYRLIDMPNLRPCWAAGRRFACVFVTAFLVVFFIARDGRADVAFSDVLRSVVTVNSVIPADARTAHSLGTYREGNGVVISDDGLS